MKSFFSQHNVLTHCILALTALSLLTQGCLSPVMVASAQSNGLEDDGRFARYGFVVSGYTAEQEQIILKTLEAFAQTLGGADRLREIITTGNHGQSRIVYYDPSGVGANTEMRLSSTVFSMEKSRAMGFSCYAAKGEETHARIVIGHEIGHLLINVANEKTGKNWGQSYQYYVGRDWHGNTDPLFAEDEAVTQISLKAQGMGYVFSRYDDLPETNHWRLEEIEEWYADFLAALLG